MPLADRELSLIELADLDGLILLADQLTTDGRWGDLVEVREHCVRASESGRQLWPVAGRIDFLMALVGPPDLAATAVESGAGRFAPGPLTEVVAMRHDWASLRSEMSEPHALAIVAQERVLRGETLAGDVRAHLELSELPGLLAEWEPAYALADYEIDEAAFPAPEIDRATAELLELGGFASADAPLSPAHAAIADALRDVTRIWDTESNGRTEVAVVAGDLPAALRQLGPSRARVWPLSAADALSSMAWAAASGGAYGRRAGAASGRFGAWWAACAIGGIDWPATPGELGDSINNISWWGWDPGAPDTGWSLRIAFEVEASGIAGCIDASDAA